MSEAPMQFSTADQRMRLVQDVADALATYFVIAKVISVATCRP